MLTKSLQRNLYGSELQAGVTSGGGWGASLPRTANTDWEAREDGGGWSEHEDDADEVHDEQQRCVKSRCDAFGLPDDMLPCFGRSRQNFSKRPSLQKNLLFGRCSIPRTTGSILPFYLNRPHQQFTADSCSLCFNPLEHRQFIRTPRVIPEGW